MKLFEKMALEEIKRINNCKETSFSIPPHLLPHYLGIYGANDYLLSTIYVAGFRAAKEMAKDCVNVHTDEHGAVSFRDRIVYDKTVHDLDAMGEEEVANET